jgi:ParB family transcriptional regulator, chromosome partitioning protein
MTMTMIPLSKLDLSPANVRKTDSNLLIDELADGIADFGLLQNLIATANKKKKTRFLVTAGGRRLRAMQRLVERGTWGPDTEVACNLLEGGPSVQSEISLMENYQRMNMTVCDEIRAFKHFVGEGDDLDGVAKRFGETRRFIEGRLRLAELAEPIFAALDEGSITLDVAKAYASTPNQDRQMMVWERFDQSAGHQNASTIRRLISESSLPSTSAISRFVGEEAYLSRGGRIEGELFTTDGDKWLDAEIAYALATDKLQEFAVELASSTGLSWVRPVLGTQIPYEDRRDLYEVTLEREPLGDDEQAKVQLLYDELENIERDAEDENLDDEQYTALVERSEAIQADIREIEHKPGVITDEVKSTSGCFVHLDSEGQVVVDPTYYTEVAPKRRSSASSSDSSAASSGSAGDGDAAPAAPVDKPLSQKLIDELSVQRRDILALNLAQHPGLALDYAIFVLAVETLTYRAQDNGSTIGTSRNADPQLSPHPQSRAHQRFAEMRDELDLSWSEHQDTVERFLAFQQLGDDMKAAILAFMVADSLKPSLGAPSRSIYGDDRTIPMHDQLAAQLEIDSADYWRPTAANFFDRVSKTKLLGILHDVGNAALSSRHMNSKKGDIASSAERLFAGDAIVEPETKDAALRWVPDHMRFNVATLPAENPTSPAAESADMPDALAVLDESLTPVPPGDIEAQDVDTADADVHDRELEPVA